LFDCLTPAAVMEKTSSSNIWTLCAYFIYGKMYGVTAAIGAPMFTLHSTGVPTGVFDDDANSSQGIMGGIASTTYQGLVGACASSAVTAASDYCWIEVGGPNVVTLVTDNSESVGYLMVSSGTDGTWSGIPDVEAAGISQNIQHYFGGCSRVAGVFNYAGGSLVQPVYTATIKTYWPMGNLI
jgi:hypothetical protein